MILDSQHPGVGGAQHPAEQPCLDCHRDTMRTNTYLLTAGPLEDSRAEREAEHGQQAGPGQERSQSRAEREEERACERRQRVEAKEKARKRARPKP